MVKRVGSREARDNFTDVVGRGHYGGEITIVERSGKPMVAVIPIDRYNRLIAEREARFRILEHIRSRLPDASLEEIQRDVAEAIATVRASSASGRP
jgi:prevent-host-death family protein